LTRDQLYSLTISVNLRHPRTPAERFAGILDLLHRALAAQVAAGTLPKPRAGRAARRAPARPQPRRPPRRRPPRPAATAAHGSREPP
jgi:hypothetical protein